MVIAVVGDFKQQELMAIIRQYFGHIPHRNHLPPLKTVEPGQLGERRVALEFDAEPRVVIGYHKPTLPAYHDFVFDLIDGIINEKDLFDALDSGKVAGAAIDVFEKEPPEDWSLANHPKVICTPHLGAATHEAQENVALAIAEQIVDYLKTGVIRNAMNAPSVAPEMLAKMKPYIELSEKMGSFFGQIIGQVISDRLTKITFNYTGETSELNTEPRFFYFYG